jgi:hypothetical protein
MFGIEILKINLFNKPPEACTVRWYGSMGRVLKRWIT